MWSIKEKDLAVKERLSKMGLLERLIGKKEPLSEVEEALKDKLITEIPMCALSVSCLCFVSCFDSHEDRCFVDRCTVSPSFNFLEEEDGAKVVRVEVTRVTSLSM
ncbi:hypothetical protein F2Q69_00052571 [Brassica cretica]|uniref:Uncharacterized protein n=1 Tax=Brassica cretica TaxID=69181 RepID=A0A8S9N038_BRACR|nr:hypothetical protein F2Q69_00052571 [Brassica cretica]